MSNENFSMEEVLESVTKIRRGQIVTGTVISVSDDEVCLDLKTATEGRIHLDHYTLDKSVTSFKGLVKIGDEMTVQISKVDLENDRSNAIYCDRLPLIKEEAFKEFVELVNNDETFDVKVEKASDKGFNVNYKGFKFFMPKTQSQKDTKVGDVVTVKAISVDEQRKGAIVSGRVVSDLVREENKKEEFESIHEGDILTGKVVKILPFACFVQFNYNQGMLRLAEVSHTFIEKIEDVLNIGDEVKVKVISLKNGKINLSRKALIETPLEVYAKNHTKGETVKGKVVNKLPYGLLLELEPNVRGLLHQSEYSWNPNDNFNNWVKVGDEVEVAIKEISLENERISLSRKALIDNPWQRVNANVNDKVSCEVTAVDSKGLTVSTLGVDGFIPTAAALLEDQRGKIEDFFTVGDKFDAIITDIKPREWQLRLSIRRLKDLEAKAEYEKYMDSEDADATQTLGDMFKDVLEK